jgi:nicotinate phosphoribosyltransferase
VYNCLSTELEHFLNHLNKVYASSLSLLTDLYQITMVYAGWKNGFASGAKCKTAVFDLYFRTPPFAGGFAVSCGLNSILDFVENFSFTADDCEYLATLKGHDGQALFEKNFLEYLRALRLSVDIDAVDEGRVVFANTPVIRVQGPLIECQLLETALLNLFNFETLIATKAARMREAAGEDQILEFGLRRAQGIDGSLSASRAAYIGGSDGTSNVLAGKIFGIPVRGTHAHSWVMSFKDEQDAFMSFVKAMPNNSVLLVDTYNTIEGVKKAAHAGQWLKKNGHRLMGIRLDSGDLAYLSIEARRILDEAGLPDAQIVASNDLDESLIANLKLQGARIDVWGVGTKLVTGYDHPALGGVFKLTALKPGDGEWQSRIKLSEEMVKVTTPGIHQVRRFKSETGLFAGDMIYDVRDQISATGSMIDPLDPTRRKNFSNSETHEDLLRPYVRAGQVLGARAEIGAIRDRRKKDIQSLHPAIRRFLNPHRYPVGLEPSLYIAKNKMILAERGLHAEELP